MNIKTILKSIIPSRYHKRLSELKNEIFDGYALKSYSQEGEDMVLRRFFENQKTGFYVDVGAHHPIRFSNTYFFHQRGWRGINIDATPGSMKMFQKYRPRDINLEIPISERKETLTYYIFNDPALNTFSREYALSVQELDNYEIVAQVDLETSTLEEVLDTYLSTNTRIDFLTVDVEGWKLQVLRSSDWQKYRPVVVLVESLDMTLDHVHDAEVYKFLRKKGYILFAKTVNTLFFRLEEVK